MDTPFMKELLNNLIESLREELKQYGEMLALLEQQHQLVILRQGGDLLQIVGALDAQAEAMRVARSESEQRQLDLARSFNLEGPGDFRELAPCLPAEYRLLVQALVDENHALLLRIQQRARQNHLLLKRALELMQRFVNSLAPGANSPWPAASLPPDHSQVSL
jgi:hypothetical protein